MALHREKIQTFIIDTTVFIFGGAVYSVGVNCFTSRNNILNGGFTGLATILNYLFSTPIGTVILLLNIPLFLLAYKKIGKKFVLRTALATFIMSMLIDAGIFLPVYSNDLLLSSVFGGVLSGIGLGVIFIRNATTGGTDIIAKLIQIKFPYISIGRSIFIFDIIIVLTGGVIYRNAESMLYACIVIFISSQTIDYIIYGKERGTVIMIITENGDKIKELILSGLHRGITVLNGYGGYTNSPKEVIICACFDNQSNKFIKKIKQADENAFFIVTQSKEILGEGFKHY